MPSYFSTGHVSVAVTATMIYLFGFCIFEFYFHISVQKFFIFCHIVPPRQEDITLSASQPNCIKELAANQGMAIILEMRETYYSRIVRLLLSYLSFSRILLHFSLVTKE